MNPRPRLLGKTLRRLLALTLLGAWCLSHAAALTHSHDANSVQGHCTMCAAATLDDVVPPTVAAADVDRVQPESGVYALPRAPSVALIRLYSPRAPPA